MLSTSLDKLPRKRWSRSSQPHHLDRLIHRGLSTASQPVLLSIDQTVEQNIIIGGRDDDLAPKLQGAAAGRDWTRRGVMHDETQNMSINVYVTAA